MSGKRVLVTAGVFSDAGPSAASPLTEARFEMVPSSHPGPLTEDELIAELEGCFAVIAASDPYTERVFAARPELKVVARWGIGYDSVDVEAATRHGVMVLNTPGVVTESVADMTFALILGIARRLPYCDRAVRAGSGPACSATWCSARRWGWWA